MRSIRPCSWCTWRRAGRGRWWTRGRCSAGMGRGGSSWTLAGSGGIWMVCRGRSMGMMRGSLLAQNVQGPSPRLADWPKRRVRLSSSFPHFPRLHHPLVLRGLLAHPSRAEARRVRVSRMPPANRAPIRRRLWPCLRSRRLCSACSDYSNDWPAVASSVRVFHHSAPKKPRSFRFFAAAAPASSAVKNLPTQMCCPPCVTSARKCFFPAIQETPLNPVVLLLFNTPRCSTFCLSVTTLRFSLRLSRRSWLMWSTRSPRTIVLPIFLSKTTRWAYLDLSPLTPYPSLCKLQDN